MTKNADSSVPGKWGALKYEHWVGYIWGIAAPFICTLIDWPLRHVLGPASILMTYLLGVFLVASRYGRGASIMASLLSAPVFAFYFARPIFSFAIIDLENIVGLAVMMVVANVTSNLLDKSRLQAELAQQRESHTSALYRLSQALAAAADRQAVAGIARQHIFNEFAVASSLVLADTALINKLDLPLQPLLAVDLLQLQQVFSQRQPSHGQGLSYYPLQGSQALLGVLVIESIQASNEEVAVVNTRLDTFLNLIAQTLERLHLLSQARDATLQAETEAMRNALLSAISHDLRTPLTRIIGAVSTLIDGHQSLSVAERLDFNKAILDEAQRMSELTGKILDMARLSSGKIILHQAWNTVEEIVGSALTRLDKSLQSRPVRTQLPDSLPLVWIDAVLLEQVLVNLIENAIKYTSEGSPIDISAQCAAGGLRLQVADYGAGIPAGMEEKIFDKFYRHVPESEQNGVGLGLALCRAIVEAHAGRITATNLSGKGAAFIIDLPLLEPPPVDWTEEEGMPI